MKGIGIWVRFDRECIEKKPFHPRRSIWETASSEKNQSAGGIFHLYRVASIRRMKVTADEMTRDGEFGTL